MKTYWTVIGCIVLLFCSGPVLAQGPAGIPPAVLSPNGWFGGTQRGDLAAPGLEVDVGYLTHSRDVSFELTGDAHQNRRRFPLEGIRLSVPARRSLTDKLGLVARGSWLVPLPGRSDSAGGWFPGWPDDQRTWSAGVQWYTLDGGVVYSLSKNLGAVFGFRFDSFSVNFSDPSDIVGNPGFPSDEADLAVTGYIPYSGWTLSYGSALKLSVIGTTYVPASAVYKETFGRNQRWEGSGDFSSGYFAEVAGEYRTNFMGGHIGFFAEWTCLHGSAPFHVVVKGYPSNDFTLSLSVDRQNWIFGGKFAIDFAGPF